MCFILQAVTLAGIWIVIYSGHFCHPWPEIRKITLLCDGKKMGNCTCSQTHLEHKKHFKIGSKRRFLKMENLWVQNTGMYCSRGKRNFTCNSHVEVLCMVTCVNVLLLYLKGTCCKHWVPPVMSMIFHALSSVLSAEYWHSILTLTLLTWRIWWAPNNASKWQMGFNSAFKGLNRPCICHLLHPTIIYKYSDDK